MAMAADSLALLPLPLRNLTVLRTFFTHLQNLFARTLLRVCAIPNIPSYNILSATFRRGCYFTALLIKMMMAVG